MPSLLKTATALRPSGVIGTLITTLDPNFTRSCASATMPSASEEITSALTGPSTRFAISEITCFKSRLAFTISDGFVVTPSIKPKS